MTLTYIRVLKYEACQTPTSRRHLDITLAVTLTSDLGETSYPFSTAITCDLTFTEGIRSVSTELSWSGVQAVQKYQFRVQHGGDQLKNYSVRLQASSASREDTHPELPDFLASFIQSKSSIIPVQFTHTLGTSFAQEVQRNFLVDGTGMSLIEETKSSIVAHVWDGGVVLAALIAALWSSTDSVTKNLTPAAGKQTLATLCHEIKVALRHGSHVVELGTGVGLLGITLSHIPGLVVTMTDLPAAEALVTSNMARSSAKSTRIFQTLDWDDSTAFRAVDGKVDVLIMSDVTYNESSHDALRSVMHDLVQNHTKIIFASKFRHESEQAFITQLRSQHKVHADTIFDGDSFQTKISSASLGDVQILVLAAHDDQSSG